MAYSKSAASDFLPKLDDPYLNYQYFKMNPPVKLACQPHGDLNIVLSSVIIAGFSVKLFTYINIKNNLIYVRLYICTVIGNLSVFCTGFCFNLLWFMFVCCCSRIS